MTCVHKVKWSVRSPEKCKFNLSVSHYKDRIVAPDEYTGITEVTPSAETQVLETKDKLVRDDIIVEGITGIQTITENGTYNVVDKATVIVDTDIQWDETLYPLTDESDPFYADKGFNCRWIDVYAGDKVIIEGVGRGRWYANSGSTGFPGAVNFTQVTGRFNYARFEGIVDSDCKLILAGYSGSRDGQHSGNALYLFYGDYLRYKIIHAS